MSVATVLCPIDFSDTSRGALVFAAAIADHFGARLTLLAVEDPVLVEAAASAGLVPSLTDETMQELRRVSAEVIGEPYRGAARLEFRVRVGKPAAEILHQSHETGTELIVMSSRGHTGVRKMFFGSTTERVLRETFVPVLVTPTERPPRRSFEDMAQHVGRVLAPADLTPASARQVAAAAGIARALSVPFLIAHVVEPVIIPVRVRLSLSGADAARRAAAEEALEEITASVPSSVNMETLILSGDPAEEIVKLAEARQANLIVMGLHSSELFGPRMGSVTYRVLSLTRTLVLALPPKPRPAATI